MDPFDVAVRQQALLEGVKNYENDEFDPTAEALVLLLALMLAKYGVQSLGDLPKRQLQELIANFNAKADKLLASFRKQYITNLRAITRIDVALSTILFAGVTGKAADANHTAIWGKIKNDPIPGTGHLPLNLLKDFTRSLAHQIGLLLRRAYAEKWNTQQLLTAMQGTRARKFKDGLLPKLTNQFKTVSQTLIQHVHSFIQFNLGRLFYNQYQWVSVLDGNTTDICKSRAGNIYDYATGPRPPAHYNCRSTIVPVVSAVPTKTPAGFFVWASGQPSAVQNAVLGVRQARLLRSGKLTAADMPKFYSNRKITPKEFGNSAKLILTGKD
jgi:SPP1 gp7 family putative phage head morphogenesis protein